MKFKTCKPWCIVNTQNKSVPQRSKIEGYSFNPEVGFLNSATVAIVLIVISLNFLWSTLQESFQQLCKLCVIICIPQRRKWKLKEKRLTRVPKITQLVRGCVGSHTRPSRSKFPTFSENLHLLLKASHCTTTCSMFQSCPTCIHFPKGISRLYVSIYKESKSVSKFLT